MEKSLESESKSTAEKSSKYLASNGSIHTDMDYIERVGFVITNYLVLTLFLDELEVVNYDSLLG